MKLSELRESLKEYEYFAAICLGFFLISTCNGYLFDTLGPPPPTLLRFGAQVDLLTIVAASDDKTVESRLSDCIDNELAPLLKTVNPASIHDYDRMVDVDTYLYVDMMSLDEEHWIAAAHLSLPIYPWTQLDFSDSESLDADQAAALVELTDGFRFPNDVEVFSSRTENALCQKIAQYVKDYPYWTAFSERAAAKTGFTVQSKYSNVFEDDSFAEGQ